MDTNKINKKAIDYYLGLPWTYTIETALENGKPYYIISVNELPGIYTDALTLNEAMESIKEAMAAAFELYLKNGEEIPEPIKEEDFKGNIAYRTSSRRHYMLAREAQRKSKSLSQFLDDCVDNALLKKN